MLAAGAAEAGEHVVGDVMAALHRDLLDRVGHIAHRDRDEAFGHGFRCGPFTRRDANLVCERVETAAHGGQHACLVADALGMQTVFIHSLAGVLSAYGMGLADQSAMREQAVEERLADAVLPALAERLGVLGGAARAQLHAQGVAPERITLVERVHLRYEGTDSALVVLAGDMAGMTAQFEQAYKRRYSFLMPARALIVEAVSVEAIGQSDAPPEQVVATTTPSGEAAPQDTLRMYSAGRWHDTGVYARGALLPGHAVRGPSIIAEDNATTVVEPGWEARVTPYGHLVLQRVEALPERRAIGTTADPVMLEIFNNRSTSRNAWTSAARSSTRTATWWPTRRTCRCIWARWARASRP
jgi:hypothetical protein